MKTTLVYIAFAASSATAIWLGFVACDVPTCTDLFKRFGYWNILALFCLALYWIIRVYGRRVVDWCSLPTHRIPIAMCFIAAAFLYTREEAEFKIVFDEPLLSNVARSMHLERAPIYQETAVFGFSNAETVDKRPLLFPFLVSLLHDITGYRIDNAFYLNAGLTLVLLLLLFALTERLANRRSAYCAVLLAAASPLMGQNASGGGFELLNLIAWLACALTAMSYWRQPDRERLAGMLFTAALFSHTRYESPLILLPVVVVIAVVSLKEKRLPTLHWSLILLPALFLPIAWQYRFVSAQDKFKQFSAEGDAFFDPRYMFENLGHAVNFLIMPSERAAASPILGAFGLLAALMVSILFVTRRKRLTEHAPDRTPAFITGLAIIFQLLIILSFTYGQLDDPIVSRLGLPFMLYLIVCSAIAVTYLSTKSTRLRYLPHTFVAVAIAYSLYQYPKIRTREADVINDYAEWILDHHRSLPLGNYLYITHLNRYLELYEIGNIQHNRALTNPEAIELHLSTSTFDKIFVAQAGTFDLNESGELTPRLLPGNDIGSAFKLKEIRQTSTIPLGFIRLSEIVAVDFDPEIHQQEIDQLYNATPFGAEVVELISHERLKNWMRSLP